MAQVQTDAERPVGGDQLLHELDGGGTAGDVEIGRKAQGQNPAPDGVLHRHEGLLPPGRHAPSPGRTRARCGPGE
ncbi:hypothetical protein GCM10019017_24920 [Streptomyces showdoensis]